MAACRIFSFCCGPWDLVPWPGLNPGPLPWEHGVLATGPPGKSPHLILNSKLWCWPNHLFNQSPRLPASPQIGCFSFLFVWFWSIAHHWFSPLEDDETSQFAQHNCFRTIIFFSQFLKNLKYSLFTVCISFRCLARWFSYNVHILQCIIYCYVLYLYITH